MVDISFKFAIKALPSVYIYAYDHPPRHAYLLNQLIISLLLGELKSK